MTSRDEYVQKLKAQLEQWNAEAGKWEAKAKSAEAGMKAEYEKHLEQWRARRDEALTQMRLLQNASADAWTEMMRGADEAWERMQEAFSSARSKFEKK